MQALEPYPPAAAGREAGTEVELATEVHFQASVRVEFVEEIAPAAPVEPTPVALLTELEWVDGPATTAPNDVATLVAEAPTTTIAEPVAPRAPRRLRRRIPALLVVTGLVVGVQLARPVPGPALHVSLAKVMHVEGIAPALPWPATGEAAVAVPAAGAAMQSGPETAVPIASLAKIMTGYVVLHDHPLATGATGPTVTLSAADQVEAAAQLAANATAVPVQPGEALTERQLLDGLLVHSANNLADVLARWDAGSVPAFVAKMNVTATTLGMRSTHYADASGLDNGTVGTAADQLRVTAVAMADRTFAAIVDQPSVMLPLAGALPNYVKAIGTDGIVGVKSGFTQAAMGCLVLAAQRDVAGRSVLVLAAVTGQPAPDPLGHAEQVDLQLVDTTAGALREVTPMTRGTTVGRVKVAWANGRTRAVAGRGATLTAWPGEAIHMGVSMRGLRSGSGAGARVGTLTVSMGQRQIRIPVRLTGGLSGPSVGWRLAHG